VTNDYWRVNGGNRGIAGQGKGTSRSAVGCGFDCGVIIVSKLPIRMLSSQPTMERDVGNGEFFAPDKHGSGGSVAGGETGDYDEFVVERELPWGERLSKDAFWVLDYLQIGYTKYIRQNAEMDGIDLDAGLKELRQQDLLDESDPERPRLIPGIP
jgi:hypothetical protein